MDSSFPPDCARLYHPGRLLAQGGYGAVWEATHRQLGTTVAVKVFLGADADPDCGAERFLDEARVTSRLTHPCIVRVVELGAGGEKPWIAYELLPGPTLRQRMTDALLPLTEALEAGAAIASALEVAHQAGVIHRDIKPENVLAAGDGRWKVADFGIAKWAGGRVHTRTGMILGTPIYLAPESLQGELITPAVDVYALGVLLYEMLAGAPPFPGEQPLDIMRHHVETPAPPVAREDVPERVKRLVARMLAKDPAARPDASGVRAELALSASGQVRSPNASGRYPRPLAERSGTNLTRPISAQKPSQALGPVSVAPTSRFEIPAPRSRFALTAALFVGGLLAAGAWMLLERPAPPVPPPPPSVLAVAEEPGFRLESATDLFERLKRSAGDIEARWAETGPRTAGIRDRIKTNLAHALELRSLMESHPRTAAARQRARALLAALNLALVADPGRLADDVCAGVRNLVLPQDARLVVLAYNLDSGPAPRWLGPKREASRAYLMSRASLDAPTDPAEFRTWVEMATALYQHLHADGMSRLSLNLGARYLEAQRHFVASGPLPATHPTLIYAAASMRFLREQALGLEFSQLQKHAILAEFGDSLPKLTETFDVNSPSNSDDVVRKFASSFKLLQPFRTKLRAIVRELALELRVFLLHPLLTPDTADLELDAARGIMRVADRSRVELDVVVAELERHRDDPGWLPATLRAWCGAHADLPGWREMAVEATRRGEAELPTAHVTHDQLWRWYRMQSTPLDIAHDQRADRDLASSAREYLKTAEGAVRALYLAKVERPALGQRLAPILADMRKTEIALGLRPTPGPAPRASAPPAPGPRTPAPSEAGGSSRAPGAAPAAPSAPAPTSGSPTPAPPSSR